METQETLWAEPAIQTERVRSLVQGELHRIQESYAADLEKLYAALHRGGGFLEMEALAKSARLIGEIVQILNEAAKAYGDVPD